MNTTVDNVKVICFSEYGDPRGYLVAIEGGEGKSIPFDIKRVFYIYGSDSTVVRGKHANRRSEFCLINICGQSKVKIIDRSGNERIFSLDKPNMGIYMPSMLWKDMYDFSPDSLMLVLSSEYYDKSEYISDLTNFLGR